MENTRELKKRIRYFYTNKTRFFLFFIRIIFFVYIGFGIVLFFFQNNLIYQSDKTKIQDCQEFKSSELISYGTSRGYLTINSSDKIIVFYHGNAGRACDRSYLNDFFVRQGYSTYFVEYTGYAETDNSTTYEKILKNVEDTISFLNTKKFTNITVVSESVGTGPAAYHTYKTKIDKLILITAYNDFVSVAFSHLPIYPISVMLHNNFTPDKWLKDYRGPVSIILAGDDEIVPNNLGKKLYDSIPSTIKRLYVIKNAGHNTIYDYPDFYEDLSKVLK